ncbi:MAG TPA: hypothetical protein VMO17_14520 [Terriglobia bacterium]|nr:hypothetical protein [Terriglobia bacterium]
MGLQRQVYAAAWRPTEAAEKLAICAVAAILYRHNPIHCTAQVAG